LGPFDTLAPLLTCRSESMTTSPGHKSAMALLQRGVPYRDAVKVLEYELGLDYTDAFDAVMEVFHELEEARKASARAKLSEPERRSQSNRPDGSS
jgi:hypothetical protein